MKRTLPCTALVAMFASVAWGQVIIFPEPPDSPEPSPMPRSRSDRRQVPLEIRTHRVHASITDQVAVTEIEQVFYNPNSRPIEGQYIFLIPTDAQIDELKMEIDGKMVPAELLDATKARNIYEDIVRRMRDPMLMEYAGSGLARVRIFPIESHGLKRVRVKYTGLLREDSGLIEYKCPFNLAKFSSVPIRDLAARIELKATAAIKSLYCPSYNVEIRREGEHNAVIEFEQIQARPEGDLRLFFSLHPSEAIALELLTHHTDEEDGYFLLLASPGLATDQPPIAKDIVFVVDTSGSMQEKKLDQAKAALKFCIANLNPEDRFQIIRFSTDAEALFPNLADASEARRTEASHFIEGMRATGATAIGDALRLSLKSMNGRAENDRPYMVIFMTDGRPTVEPTNEDKILAFMDKFTEDASLRLFSFGLGTDVNTHLLDKMAQRGHAFSQYVLPEQDVEVVISNFYRKIRSPVLTQLALEVSGGIRLRAMHPSPLGDLFSGDQLVVLGRYRDHGNASLTLSGTVSDETRTAHYDVAFSGPDSDSSHAIIPRLWATRRVGFLLEQLQLHGDNVELREQITKLARRYGIVTPYTAYLILEDEKQRPARVASAAIRRLFRRSPNMGAEMRMKVAQMVQDVSGPVAVRGAATAGRLRRANRLADANVLGVVTSPTESSRKSDLSSARNTRYVEGKTFYRNGDIWVDAELAENDEMRRIKIRFASEEYFQLFDRYPKAVSWLALGPHVHVVLDGVIHEIFPDS